MATGAILYLAGSAIFLVLGLLHGWLTFKDERRPHTFAPRDDTLLAAMEKTPPRISGATTLWRAGLGFHYSHSLGLAGFGLLFGGLALFAWPVLKTLTAVYWAAPLVAALYLFMAIRYWFRSPAIGAGLGLVLFLAGAITG